MRRFFYTLKQLVHYRQALKSCWLEGAFHSDVVENLSPSHLKESGIRALAIDFDGVLAAHGELYPSESTLSWLEDCCGVFGENKVYILSNKPLSTRSEYFAQHYPQIKFVVAKRKKPYPDGLQSVIDSAQVPAEHTLMIDDRLATGILVSLIVGAKGCLITKPRQNFCKRPVKESFFSLLRLLEQAWVRRA